MYFRKDFEKLEEAVSSFITAFKLLTRFDYGIEVEVNKGLMTSDIKIKSRGKRFIVIDEVIMFLGGKRISLHFDIFMEQPWILYKLQDEIQKFEGQFEFSKEDHKCSFVFNSVDDCIGFINNNLLDIFED